MSDFLWNVKNFFKSKLSNSSRLFVLVSFIILSSLSSSTLATSFNDPLIDAADLGDVEQVSRLLKEGAQPDAKGDFGTTALMRAAFRGNTDIIQILLESGAYINAADIGGETALHLAAKNGHIEAVKSLIYYGAFVDVPDKEQWTPLMRATLAKQPDVVKALIDKGADITAVNSIHESVLVHAAIAGVPDIAAMIISSPKSKNISKDQETLAISMAKRKKHDNVEKVITKFMEGDNKPILAADSKAPAPEEEKATIVKPAPIPTPPPLKIGDKELTYPDKKLVEPAKTEAAKPVDLKSIDTKNAEKPVEIKPTDIKSPTKEAAYEYSGIFFVQLGNFNDTSSAEAAWDKTLATNKDVLSKLAPKIVKANSGQAGTVYRLRAGTLSTKAAADSTCKAIRSKNSECYVVEITNPTPAVDTPEKSAALDAPNLDKSTADYLSPVATGTASNIAKTGGSAASMSPTAFSGSYPKLSESALAAASAPLAQEQPPAPSAPIDIDPTMQAAATPMPSQSTPIDGSIKADPIAPINGQSNPKIDYSYPGSARPSPKSYPSLTGNNAAPVMPKQPAPVVLQQSKMPEDNSEFSASKEQARNEVQEMTRENFFRKQGITPPVRAKKEYDDFYKQMENKKKEAPVSEAVLVPDETYFTGGKQANSGQSSGGSWINISNLPSEEFANDYGIRMFKKDQSLGNVQVIVMKPLGAQTVSMRVGPLLPTQTDALCSAVNAGGFACSATGGSASQNSVEAGYSPTANSAQRSANIDDNPFSSSAQPDKATEFWISLGTFASNSEAEYYWMFVKEDNGDILNALKYNLGKAPGASEFADGAVQLRTGPFGAKQRAAQLCNIMRYRNIACLVSE